MVWIGIASGAIGGTSAGAEDELPPEVAVAQAGFQERLEAARAPLDGLVESYLRRLGELKKASISSGELERALMVENEIEQVGEGGLPTSDVRTYPELDAARRIYTKSFSPLSKREELQVRAELKGFRAKLEALQVKLTHEGRLDDAAAARGLKAKHGNDVMFLRQGVSRDRLVLHYTFGEDSGGRVTDASDQGNDGVNHGATWERSPEREGVMRFGGDAYIDCGSPGELDLRDDFSVSVWVNARSFGDGRGVVSSYQNSDGFTLRTGWDDKNSTYQFGDYGDSLKMTSATQTGRWYHLVTVMDSGTMRFYADGELAELKELGRGLVKAEDRLNIGRCYSSRYFDGLIDDVRIYRRVLTEGEVAAIYAEER